MPITIEVVLSKKNNPFIAIKGGRAYGLPPWLSPEEAQAVLDNEATVRAFIAQNRSNRPMSVTTTAAPRVPKVVTPPPNLTVVPTPPAPAVERAAEPQREPAPAPLPPPLPPLPKQEGVSRQQTDITQNLNPKVAALVARAMGKTGKFKSVA